MSGYSEEALHAFTLSRERIRGGEIKGLVALKNDKRVAMTLDDYYAIGVEMNRLRAEAARLQSVLDDVQAALDGCG